MCGTKYRFNFREAIAFAEVVSAFDSAFQGAVSIHGESAVRLDARYSYDTVGRELVIEGSTEVGECLNRLFVGILRERFGDKYFQVERVNRHHETQTRPGAAA